MNQCAACQYEYRLPTQWSIQKEHPITMSKHRLIVSTERSTLLNEITHSSPALFEEKKTERSTTYINWMSEHQGYMIVHIYMLLNNSFRATVFDNCNPRLDLYSCEKKNLTAKSIIVISHGWKYCWLICCGRKILFVGWKSTAYKPSEQGDGTTIGIFCAIELQPSGIKASIEVFKHWRLQAYYNAREL